MTIRRVVFRQAKEPTAQRIFGRQARLSMDRFLLIEDPRLKSHPLDPAPGDGTTKSVASQRGHIDASEIRTLRQLHQAGRLGEAEALCGKILYGDPDNFDANFFAGVINNQNGNNARALEFLRRAAQLDSGNAFVQNSLGITLDAQGQWEDAIACFRRAIELKSNFAMAHFNIAVSLMKTRELAEAETELREAIELQPHLPRAYFHLGNVLEQQGRHGEAGPCYQKAIAQQPDFFQAYERLAHICNEFGYLAQGEDCLRKLLSMRPGSPKDFNTLGSIQKDAGKIGEAVGSYEKALSLDPDYLPALSNLLFVNAYFCLQDPPDYLALARQWERQFLAESDARQFMKARWDRRPPARRRLRVGYVSGDFWGHAVANFITPVFAHHDRERIEVFAYPTNRQRYQAGDRIRSYGDHWVFLDGMSDSQACERIRSDEIDVLVDLSGHTGGSRLSLFARRCAPVQAHYLGYFASTGLTEMDYWIGDGVLTPAETDHHFAEKVWRLPNVWISYNGDGTAPDPARDRSGDRAIRLGTFNSPRKLAPATFSLWARILHALPDAQLLLKNKFLTDADLRKRILTNFAGCGIPENRIVLQDESNSLSWHEHMAQYRHLDLALDPIGAVSGGTTTCEALWMGLPVIALEGDRMASRMSASMLSAIAHQEWIARSEQEYLEKVVALAKDPQRRSQIRHSLRGEMARSPLCDAKALARALEDAYSAMFARWLSAGPESPTRAAGPR